MLRVCHTCMKYVHAVSVSYAHEMLYHYCGHCMHSNVRTCRQHPRLSRAKFHFRDCGSLGRWPQDGMRPVKMVLRPQVCVCVIERRVRCMPTWKPGCPFLQSTLQKLKWSKEAIFLKKWLNKAFQDTVGRIMSPRGGKSG